MVSLNGLTHSSPTLVPPLPELVLDTFSKTETINSLILEDEFIEASINEDLKFKFKEGYQAF
jgi:hypothetical protein